VNIKAFFVDALTSALDLAIGTPADVIRHVTPDVLSIHLPRPLWARLLTACLGAPRVDAQLIVETIGIPNLCEHVPSTIIWACIAEIGSRSLGKVADIPVAPAPLPKVTSTVTSASGTIPARTTAERQAVLAPPPDERPAAPPPERPVALGPSIPSLAASAQPTGPEVLADVINELESSDEPRLAQLRPRSPTAQRFRQSNTSSGRLGQARRPQAAAAVPQPVTQTPSGSTRTPRREATEVTVEADETMSGHGRASSEIPVDDSQLVDWQATDGVGHNSAADDDFSDLGRKR
jgi:hypothetical protein